MLVVKPARAVLELFWFVSCPSLKSGIYLEFEHWNLELAVVEEIHICDWYIESIPDDGGRISRLSYKGNELLCRAPSAFRSPSKDYGLYETRPVYGYDDCFPTVDKCKFPCAPEFDVPDHGELCWRKWALEKNGNVLIYKTASRNLPIEFTRKLVFSGNSLTWNFEISNNGSIPIPFLHVMHPLMPLASVNGFKMPEFSSAYDEVNQREAFFTDAKALEKHLKNISSGKFSMLILRGVKAGRMNVNFKFPLRLEIVFPEKQFTSIGIWWNNSGYPAEPGLERCECAFEPIPGDSSSLESNFKERKYLSVEPGGILSWYVEWNVVETHPSRRMT